MKHLLRSSGFRTLLLAGGLFAITLPLLNSCKSTGNSSSMKKSHSDTATMSSDSTGGGKQTETNKDKKP